MDKYLKKIDPLLISNLAAGASNYFTPSNAPVVDISAQNIFDTIITLNNLKTNVTIMLFFWGISRIIIEFLPEQIVDDKQKSKATYINKVLFGDMGIIPMIFIIWVLVLIISSVIPALVDISPKFSSLISGFNRFISSIVGANVHN